MESEQQAKVNGTSSMPQEKLSKIIEQYKKIKKLGDGAYGTAYLCEGQQTKKLRVVKEIDMKDMDEKQRKAALKEAKIMEKLTHPNIIKSYDVYKTKKGKLCIVMEYADGGDLNQ